MPTLAIVVPCFNEEQVLPEIARRMLELLQQLSAAGRISADSHVYFVDDGSQDRTWSMIEELARSIPLIKGIKLSCNRGHQNALLSGLLHARGDMVITIDADLQDDLDAVSGMLHAHAQGCDVVYGVRSRRDADSFFKRLAARAFYRLLLAMGVDVVFDHADFRLLSRRAIEALRQYEETNLFLRGIIPTLGFKNAKVHYERRERFAGQSKYPLGKMLVLAIDGITSLSPVPLRLMAVLGVVVTTISTCFGMWAIATRLFTSSAVPGWASTVVPVYFIGGLQLLGIGVIGEYLAKVYMEVKRRPRFIIEKIV